MARPAFRSLPQLLRLVDWRAVRMASVVIIASLALIVPFGAAGADDRLLARDRFDRSTASGWRAADTGGRYTHPTQTDDFKVDNGEGSVVLRRPGAGRVAALESVAARNANMRFRVASDRRATGEGQIVTSVLRSSEDGGEYRVQLRFAADGKVWLSVARYRNGNVRSIGAEQRVQGLPHAPGRWIWFRSRVRGTNPTTIEASAWTHGTAQPKPWSLSVTDASDVEAAGSVAVKASLPSSATNAPIRMSFDDLRVHRAGGRSGDSPTPDPTDPGPTPSPTPSPTPTPAPTGTPAPTATPSPTAPPAVVALDTFDRQVSGGWGRADVGDQYGILGPTADFNVDGRVGNLRMSAAGNTRSAALSSATARDVDLSFMVATDRTTVVGSQYAYGVARRVASGTEYRLKIRFSPSGAAYIQATRVVSGVETSLGAEVRVPAADHSPGRFVRVRGQVSGRSPVSLRMRAWRAGTAEPTTWAYQVQDTTPALETAGAVGLMAYISATTTNAPISFAFDEFRATAPHSGSLPPVDPTPTPTPTPSPTPPAPTPTPTSTPSPTPTPTPPAPTPTPTPTLTPTPTPTPSPLPADAYVVSTSGSDADPGTAARPWRTLQKAADAAPVGATVFVREGSYAGFTMRRSGTASAPISFERYPGDARPVVDGTIGDRMDVVKFSNVRHIRFVGFVVQNAQGGTFSGSGIRTENGASDILISDSLIRDNQSFGVITHSSDRITVRDNELTGNAAAVYVSYRGEGTRILDNRVHHNDRMLRNTPRDVAGNDDSGAVGLGFHKSSGAVLVRGNDIWGNRAPSYDYTWDGSAFEFYGASNVTLTDNRAWDNENILETGTDGSSGLECRNNVMTRNVAWGGTTAGRSFGMFLRCATNMLVANNTFYHMDGFIFSLGADSGNYSSNVNGMRIINNVLVQDTGKVYGIEGALPASVVIDNNLVRSNGYVATIRHGGSTTSLQQFRDWTGFEQNGLGADPRFMDAAGRDFQLRADSPAIDRGVMLPGVTDTHSGAAPDLGRFERPD